MTEAISTERDAALVQRFVIRLPSCDRERRIAAANSTDEDLLPTVNGRVLVTGTLPNGDRVELGDVCEIALRQSGRALVDRVRFAR